MRLPVVIHPAETARVAGELRIPVRATIRNISANGLLVHSEQQLVPGTQLEFVFRTPGGAAPSWRPAGPHVQPPQIEPPELGEAGGEFRESALDSREQLVKFVLK